MGDVLSDLESTINTTFQDGIIEKAEAISIEKYINEINVEKLQLDNQYSIVYANTSLVGTAKTNLATAKTAYNNNHTTLINSINTAISDGKTTVAEKNAVNTNFGNYRTALGTLSTRLSEAIESIRAKASTDLDTSMKAYAQAQDNLKETIIKAYSDGIVTAEEQRAIADAEAKLAEAKADATAKANSAKQQAIDASAIDAQNKANQAQANAIASANQFSLDAFKAIQVGNRNLLSNSNVVIQKLENEAMYLMGSYTIVPSKRPLEIGKKYTLVVKGSSSGAGRLGVWVNGQQEIKRDIINNENDVIKYITFTVTNTPTRTAISFYHYPQNSTGTSKVEWATLYEGEVNKPALDWTPAPEDINDTLEVFRTSTTTKFEVLETSINSKVSQSDYNALNQRVGTAESTISQQANQIQSKVSQTAFDSLNNTVGGLTGRVSSAESTITQQANLIATKVTQSHVDVSVNNAVGNINIGGRNYITNSAVEWATTGMSSNSAYGVYRTNLNDLFAGLLGKPIMISFDAKVDLINGATSGAVRVYSSNGNAKYIYSSVIPSVTSEWARYEAPINLTNTSNTGAGKIEFYGEGANSNLVKIYIRNLKLEVGTKATDWTPAPEDIDVELSGLKNRVSTAETTITQNADAIALRATKTEVTSQVSTAKSEAINSASTDATTKANNALASSKTYTDNSITVTNNAISLKADKTITDALTNRVTTAESKITPSAIISTVKDSTEQIAKDAVDGIIIGGTNTYSNLPSITPISVLTSGIIGNRNDSNCPNGFSYTATASATGSMRLGNVVTGNGEWTLSGWVRGTQSLPLIFEIDICDIYITKTINVPNNNQWVYFSHTVNVTNYSALYHFVDFSKFNWAVYQFKDIKVEKGNKATAWSPNPADVDNEFTSLKNRVTSTETSITQQSDQIALRATKTEVTNQVGTALSSANTTAQGYANTAEANAVKEVTEIKDTRDTNQNPAWYFTNHKSKTLREFKSLAVLGVTVAGYVYGQLTTFVPWTDTSGGAIQQELKVGSRIFTRAGTTTAWSSWIESESTVGSQSKADSAQTNAVSSAKTYTDAQITIANNAITLKADKTVTDGLNSRMNTAESKITPTAIINTVKDSTETIVNNAVGNLQVGATNIFYDSYLKSPQMWGTSLGTMASTAQSVGYSVRYNKTSTDAGAFGYQRNSASHTFSVETGQDYTLSFDIRGNIGYLNYVFLMRNESGQNNQQLHSELSRLDLTGINSTTYIRVSTTFKPNFTNDVASILLALSVGQTFWFEIKNIKVEKGNKATDYSPNPYEVETRISTTESTLIQQAGLIASKVSQTEVNTTVNNAVNNMTLSNRNILLKSNTPFKKLSTDNIYQIGNYQVAPSYRLLPPNKVYTLVVKGSNSGAGTLGVWVDGSQGIKQDFISNETDVIKTIVFTRDSRPNIGGGIYFYHYPQGSAGTSSVDWACLYEGNITKPNLEWLPAPEDTDNANVVIGGRNLIYGGFENGSWNQASIGQGTDTSMGRAKNVFDLSTGSEYTFSMKEGTVITPNRLWITFRNADNTYHSVIIRETIPFTFTAPAPKCTITYNTGYYSAFNGGSIFKSREPKLELGNKVTGWTQAPEDIDSELSGLTTTVTNHNTQITQNTTAINLRATKSEVTAQVNTAKNEAINEVTEFKDTRSDNQTPAWYFANYPKKTVKEFKFMSAIGITGVAGTYCQLETTLPWNDSSGGTVVQTATVDNRVFQRYGSSTSWTSWTESENTIGSQNKANSAKTTAVSESKTYTDSQITVVNNAITLKSDKTVTDGLTARMTSAETKITPDAIKSTVRAETQQIASDAVANIQVGGRNLLLNSNSGAHYFGGYSGASVTKTNNTVSVPEWGATDANRVISSGGNSTVRVLTAIGIPKTGETVTASGWFKNNGTKNIVIASNQGSKSTILAPNEGKRIVFEGIEGNGVGSVQFQVNPITISDNVDFTWWRLQYEYGNKATDWKPSPEDVENKVTALTTRVTNAETDITQSLTEINLRATKTEVTSQVNNAKTDAINTASNDATTKANNARTSAIASASTDATTKANTAQTNAVASSKTYTDNQISITNNTILAKADKTVTDGLTTRMNNAELKIAPEEINLTVKAQTQAIANQASAQAYANGKMLYTDPSFVLGANSMTQYPNAVGTTMTRVNTQTDSPTKNSIAYKFVHTGIADSNKRLSLVRWANPSRPNAVFVTRIVAKLPVGWRIMDAHNSYGDSANRSATWLTPTAGTGMYEEYVLRLVCGNTGDFSTVNHFDLRKVSASTPTPTASTPVESYIAWATVIDMSEVYNKPDEEEIKAGISITANAINIFGKELSLTGKVTFSSLDPATQSTVNTASNNASTAISTANTANSNANTAKTDATSAKTTANTANTNASNAVTTANTANSNASSALSTANTASSNASTALSTANTANTNATNAKSKTDAWSFASTTEIDGAKIRTGTITADKINTDNLTARQIKTSENDSRVSINESNDGQFKVRHSNGQVAIQMGLVGGIPKIIFYDSSGNKVWEGGTAGIVYVNDVPESWTPSNLFFMDSITSATETLTSTKINTFKSKIKLNSSGSVTNRQMDAGTNYYLYAEGINATSGSNKQYAGYHTTQVKSVSNFIPNGWYIAGNTTLFSDGTGTGTYSGIVFKVWNGIVQDDYVVISGIS
ncbi:hypothetical protein [Sphingobacterium daejeonense]|uniref:hypothetical protein n=1 Tax=Sphingobacterium daejeonense TaxID=371142 RepID=UPI0010C4A137|nr:hypothetical protein [Sphingobacterium daejeonense]VTP97583.1 Uncharacterised protein [Sphingobacterium daejeonense]